MLRKERTAESGSGGWTALPEEGSREKEERRTKNGECKEWIEKGARKDHKMQLGV